VDQVPVKSRHCCSLFRLDVVPLHLRGIRPCRSPPNYTLAFGLRIIYIQTFIPTQLTQPSSFFSFPYKAKDHRFIPLLSASATVSPPSSAFLPWLCISDLNPILSLYAFTILFTFRDCPFHLLHQRQTTRFHQQSWLPQQFISVLAILVSWNPSPKRQPTLRHRRHPRGSDKAHLSSLQMCGGSPFSWLRHECCYDLLFLHIVGFC
jgi:hypothetical protein